LAVVALGVVGAAVVAQQEVEGSPSATATKVVPIVSLGSGVRVGAAQVSGPEEYVRLVGVVAQIEAEWGDFRIRALVPAAALPGNSPPDEQKLRRVPKVSVRAIIDMRI